MKNDLLEMNLQLFAESEAPAATGGEAAGTAAETTADTGVSGDPARAEGSRPKIFPAPANAGIQQRPARRERRPLPAPTAEAQQAPAAETWEDVKKRYAEQYGADVKAAVDKRFRNHADQEQRLGAAMQALASIAPFYGLDASDPANIDLDKLSKAIQDDDRFYEQAALDKGIPVETEKHIRQLEMQEARRQAEARQSLEQQQLRSHIAGLREQEAQLKQEFPDFDLMAEIQNNPVFARMTAPGSGLTVRQAFMAIHGDELRQQTAQAVENRTKSNMSRAIQAGGLRPQENGMTGGNGQPRLDPGHMTREQREEIRRRVRQGERITF